MTLQENKTINCSVHSSTLTPFPKKQIIIIRVHRNSASKNPCNFVTTSSPSFQWINSSEHRDSSCKTAPERHQLHMVPNFYQTTHKSQPNTPFNQIWSVSNAENLFLMVICCALKSNEKMQINYQVIIDPIHGRFISLPIFMVLYIHGLLINTRLNTTE